MVLQGNPYDVSKQVKLFRHLAYEDGLFANFVLTSMKQLIHKAINTIHHSMTGIKNRDLLLRHR